MSLGLPTLAKRSWAASKALSSHERTNRSDSRGKDKRRGFGQSVYILRPGMNTFQVNPTTGEGFLRLPPPHEKIIITCLETAMQSTWPSSSTVREP